MLWAALHFPSLPPESLEPIAAWACQFTPKVSLEPPQALLLEIAGSLRCFGGPEELRQRLEQGCQALGFAVRLATAPTPRAALWRARSAGDDLDSIPLQVTGFDLSLFNSIGIRTVGELRRLPREGLARRCGQALLDDLDRALGAFPEPRRFFVPPPRFDARIELPAPVAQAEGLLFAARRLLVQLEGLLTARHEGVRGFVLHLDAIQLHIGLASPTRDTTRLMDVLRERLATISLREPVEIIRIHAGDFEPLHACTAGMFGDPAAETEGWSRLLERLRARLGREAVHGLATQPDHRPEHAWRSVDPGEWDPREFRQPGPRPLWLLDSPRRVAGEAFQLLAGPERIEAGWWDGDEARRDYFVASLQGGMAWVFRENGEWFLHGFFA
jgi:protein ImuB